MVSSATAVRSRVGAELRRLRETAGLSGGRVAATLGWSQAKVSRIEAAKVAHAVADVGALLELYGAPDDVKAELLSAVAGELGVGAWLVRPGDPGGAPAAREVAATRLREYQPQLVPALLQTRDYAEAVVRLAGTADAAGAAEARLRWQEAVRTPAGPRYEAVLDARALMVEPGAPGLLTGQLDALVTRSAEDAVRLRVVPVGAPVVALSPVPFRVYEFRRGGAEPVVYVETPTAEVYLAAATDTAKFLALFRRLAASALSVQDSVRYLGAVRDAVTAGSWPCRLDVG
ncbi:MAG: helix-turn-helix domain protein [Cryptosporangiaceae bacterium]|nr:helix-turn-helix domain protein [Cryptosporangiaceae bacterium]